MEGVFLIGGSLLGTGPAPPAAYGLYVVPVSVRTTYHTWYSILFFYSTLLLSRFNTTFIYELTIITRGIVLMIKISKSKA